MKQLVRNVIAILAGLVLGSLVNMGLIMMGSVVVTPPNGMDISTMEGLIKALPLFELRHFLFPFLAHSFGTLVGAVVAALLAVSHELRMAFVIGVFFLVGGIVNVVMLPAPLWFNTLDLLFAYLPMAWLGGHLGKSCKKN